MARDLCVIFNPAAGKRRAQRRFAKLRQRFGQEVDFQATTGAGHAVELARQAALDGFRTVAAAGGDGTAHEVANGLLQAQRPEVCFGLLPVGSANDYAYSVATEFGAGTSATVDVGQVRTPDGRQRHFICCLGLGLNGSVTRQSRRIALLQGVLLYGWATVRALVEDYACPRMRIQIDDQPAQETPTLLFTALIGKREGGFLMAPRAALADGWLDFVHGGCLSRWEVLQFLPRLALQGAPASYPKVAQGRCRRIHLVSEQPLNVHADGELFCTVEDKVRELHVDIVPQALRVQLIA